MNTSVITDNLDIFVLPGNALTARHHEELIKEELARRQPAEVLDAQQLGARIFAATQAAGALPADLDGLAAETGLRAAEQQRIQDALRHAIHRAHEEFERAVRFGAGSYMQDLCNAWEGLLGDVRELGDVPADAETAVQRHDLEGYEQLKALVVRADRIRWLHMHLLGDGLLMEGKAFTDTAAEPEKAELANVGRRLLRPAGPESATARLLWLASRATELALSAEEANARFATWRRALTHFPALESR